MRVIHFALAVCLALMMAGLCVAQGQMGQNPTDQSQMGQTTSNESKATVQQGPVVRAGLPYSADVFVNGKFALRVPTSAGGMSPMTRAQEIADRLNQAFASGMSWNDMRVAQVNGQWTVTLGDKLIATADSSSACALGISESSLANKWASQTVVAMGGQPSMIASQLTPTPSRVAGSRQQVGASSAMMWTTSTTKVVPLINAQTGNELGSVTVAGSQKMLDMVNSALVYQSTTDNGATVYTFVPITGTSATNPSRVPGVGLISVPATMVPMSGIMTGDEAMTSISSMVGTWNSLINTQLRANNLQVAGANTKIVPLYSMDRNMVVGAAQVIGPASAVSSVQAVVATRGGDMIRFNATPTACTPLGTTSPPILNNVVVSAIILMPSTPSPSATEPGTTTPSPETTPPAPPTTETPGTTTP